MRDKNFGIQNDHLWQSHAGLSHGVEDSRHYETISSCSPNCLSSNKKSSCSPEFLGFSPSSSISLSHSTVSDKRKAGSNYYERGHREIPTKVAVWNITSTIHENEEKTLARSVGTTELVETGDQLKIKAPVGKCALPKELKIIPDQSISSHTVLTDQCSAILSNEDSIGQAVGAGFSPSDRESTFTSWNETDESVEKNVLTLLDPCSVGMNAGMVKCPIPQITELLPSDKETNSAPRRNVEKSCQLMDHCGNYDKAVVCTLPIGSEGSIQEQSLKERSTVQKPDSNSLKRKHSYKRRLRPQFTGIFCSNADQKNVGGTSSDKPTALGVSEVNNLCKTLKIPEDTVVLYLPPDGSKVESETEIVICLSPDSEILSENYQVVLDIPCSKYPKLIPSKRARPLLQMEKHGAPRVLNSDFLHNDEVNASDSVNVRTSQLNNKSPGQVDEIGNGQHSLGDKIVTLTPLDVNPSQQVSGEQTVSDLLKRSCRIDNKKADVFNKAQKSSLGFPNQQMNSQNHGQQVTKKCRFPSVCLMEDENEKRVDGICLGDNGHFYEQSKKRQAVEHITLNTDRPFNVHEKSAGSVSTQLPQTVGSDGKLEYLMKSELKMSDVCSSDRFNEDEEGKDSVPSLKTVSTIHPSQLMDIERVVENISPARLMSKSTKVGGKLAESTVPAVKGQNIANLSPRDKRPHQPDNSEPTVKRGLSLEGKQLHETTRNESVSNGSSATNDLQAVRCPSNVNKKIAMSTSTTTQSSPQTICTDSNLKNVMDSEPTVRSISSSTWFNEERKDSVPSIKTVSTGQQLYETNRNESVSDGASATNHLQAVGCPSNGSEKFAMSTSTTTQSSPQTICSNGNLKNLMDSEPTVQFVWPSDRFDEDEKSNVSVPSIKTVSTGQQQGKLLHETNHNESVSDGASATNDSQAVRCPANVNEKFAMSTSTTTQSSPQTTCSDGNLKNLMDSEPTVQFVWPSDRFDEDENSNVSVPSIKTVSTGQQLYETNRNESVSDGASATNHLQAVGCPSNSNEKFAMSTSTTTQSSPQTICSNGNLKNLMDSEPTVQFVWPSDRFDEDEKSTVSVPSIKTVSTGQQEGKQLHETYRIESVSDGASAANDLQAVRCPSYVKEKFAMSTSTTTKSSPQTTCSDGNLKNLMDSEPTVRFVWPSDRFDGVEKSNVSVPSIKTVSTGQQEGKQLHETNRNESVSDGASATNDLQAVRCPSNVNEKFAMSTSTTTQSSPQTTCSNGNLKNLMDSEPTVRFVWPSDRFDEDEKSNVSVPSIKTVSTGQQEGKQLHETHRNESVSDGASATNDLQAVRCPSNVNEKFAISTSITTQSSPQTTCSDGNLKNLMDSERTVKFVWSSDWFNEDEKRKDSVPPIKSVPARQEGKQLHETNANKNILDGTSATNDFQTVRCIFPGEWKHSSSKRSKNPQGTCPDECNTLTSVQLVSRRISRSDISLDSQFEKDGRNRPDISSENVSQNLSEADVISESSMPETRCMLPCDEQDENYVRHIEHCETIDYALDLRTKQSSVFQSLPIDAVALNIVNKIIGCVCKQFLLDNLCTDDHCSLVHNVQLSFDLPGHDFKISFNVFSKWYLSNSKQPNLKVLLQLLSLLSRDFGDELLITILCFSSALLQVAQNFRRALGIKLIEKLVHLVDFTKENAIRTIITFNLSHDTEEAIITDLLHSLGVYEEDMTSLYESVSCIWHINGNYSFSQNVLFAMLKECLQEMPPKFDVTKKKIIDELLKYPRSVLNKHFNVIERLLLKYYALNSLAAYKVRCVVYYGKIPKPEDDTTRKKSYLSSRVKSTGPINWNWEYLDLNEQRRKSFELDMYKMVLDEKQTEEVCAPLELSTAPDFKMEELLDGKDISDNLKLLTTLSNDSTVESSKYVSRMEKALKRRKYKRLCRIVMKSAEGKSLDTYMNELYDMLTRLDESELPCTIYECLKLMPQSELNKTASLIRNKFTVIINSLVLMFYKNRDFKSALKLLKTLRISGVNPLGFPPDEIDEQSFTVVCSDIHFECRSMLEALRILLYKDCLNYVRYNCMPILSNHFRLLERLVVKMLKCFVTKRLPSLALILFRALFLAQKDLFFPIDIGKYYELVLCNSFITCKASCAPHDGANLFILVQKSCRRGEVLRSTTYRSLVVELVRVKAPDDILRRILQLCLHYKVYPAFTRSPITLGTHLLVEEMYIYLLHCFQYLLDQHRPSFLQQTCTVQLVPTPKPLRRPCPFLEDLKQVKTEISYAAERFEEALRRIVGPAIYPDLSLNFSSPSEIVIPSVGMEAVAGTLLGDRD